MSMPLSFFMWSINRQTRVISGKKKREASTQNLHIAKNVNESWNISSLRSILFINTCLIFSWQKVGKKIAAWTHCFSRTAFSYRILESHVMFPLHLTAVNKSQGQRIIILQVVLTLFKWNNHLWTVNFENSKLWNYKEEFCALHASANGLWKCLMSEAFYGLVKKMRTPVLLSQIVCSNGKNTHSLTGKLFIKVSATRHSRLELFPPLEKILCIGTHCQVACEKVTWNMYLKNPPQGYTLLPMG